MSTVEAEPKQEVVTFISQGRNFRAVLRGPVKAFDDKGAYIQVEPEIVADFAPEGMFSTDDPRIIKHLEGLHAFQTVFYKMGEQPGAEKPSVEEQLFRIIELGDGLDLVGLRELAAGEQAGYNRQLVVRAALKACEVVERAAEAA
jgi:hypothetical protein